MSSTSEIWTPQSQGLNQTGGVYAIGSEDSYSGIVARKLFPDSTGVEHISVRSLDDAIKGVRSNPDASAVVPVENNGSTRVHEISDVIFQRKLIVEGVAWLKVYIHLLGLEGAGVEKAERIFSHNQA